ncbi:DUF2197 domain-containing protein [Viridibacillus sp. FSL E2-0187]|uniref:DUF2197 domain-containing protein n=1 Tax=Viridibacillus TaxID=496496 RepID=UPI0030F62490
MVIYYEVICGLCKEPYKLIEGTKHYKLYKERKAKNFHCVSCTKKLEHVAKRKRY